MGRWFMLKRDLRKLARLPALELLAALWRLLRPAFWIVTIFPVYLGYVYASGQLLPAEELWVAYVREGLANGFSVTGWLQRLLAWLSVGQTRRFLGALLVIGPFIWGGTLLYNDVQDLDADRDKPMRSESPLVQGYISPGTALGLVYVLSAVGMGISFWIGPVFFALMAVCLFLSWAYSAPPLHLKARPGWDVAINVAGIGVLCFLAGYVLAAPLSTFPWYLLAPATLTLAAVYLPTVIVDYNVDLRHGYSTTAVELGRRRAYLVGLAAMLASDASLLAIAVWTDFLPLAYFGLTWPAFLVKDAAYVVFIGSVRSVTKVWIGIFLVGVLVGVVNLVFVLVHTGFWTL